jgi:glycosyltransferase involved in cell wall biosynthesis
VIRYDRSAKKRIERSTVDGITLITLKVNYSQSMGVMARLKSFTHFMLVSTYIALKEKDIDFVIATSTPLTIGFPALVLKKIRRIPYLFEVRDLWPEVPIQMGGLKNKLGIKIAKWFERTIYKNASHIIALSPGMQDGVIQVGTPPEKVSMIPNMSKIDKFWPRENNLTLMNELGIRASSFKIIYFGAVGEANAIDYILDSAALLKDNKEIDFIFIGNGSKQTFIEESIINQKLTNVQYLGVFNMEKTSEIVNMCDVSLVTFSNIPILATNSPNKLFDSLSAGKPIIVNSNGWTKELVEKNECGIFVDPESPHDFVKKLLKLKESPQVLKKMGLNSRRLAETEYDKSILCKKFADIVDSLDYNRP